MIAKLSYYLMCLLNWLYFQVKIIGKENIPQGGVIIACNHISNLDPFILGYSFYAPGISFLAKEELFKTRWRNLIFRGMGAFPVKRDTADLGSIRESLRRLKKGCRLIMFPEGTRGSGSRAKQAQPGIGFVALKSQIPVCPVFMKDSDKALPNGARWFRRYPITLIVGPPIIFTQDEPYDAISQKIINHIYALNPA